MTNSPYYWLNEPSRQFLSKGYLADGQSAEDRIEAIAKHAGKILKDKEFATKFVSYMERGFYSLSTPVWINFDTERGLPVSCFNSHVSDTMDSILYKAAEVGTMSKLGGGTSGFFGDLRPRGSSISVGGESGGPIHFMELYDKVAEIVSQGSARRGSFAAYLPIEHPDIKDFLKIRSDGHAIKDMSIGVTVSDAWLKAALAGDKEKREVWCQLIEKKYESGYPYIVFSDTVNRAAPAIYKKLGRKINASNLCTEIFLSSNEDESFVCVLSSLNLLHWDEIVKTDAVETMIQFLDAVNEEFVIKSKGINFMQHAHNFAKRQRALGMGCLGWHSLLQSKNLSFDSIEAKFLNTSIWRTIRKRADAATQELAERFGEPEMLVGTGRRNVTTLAIAPTTSSSFILGQVSPSIEPENSNYYVKKLAKGSFPVRNQFLEARLKELGKNDASTWKSILVRGGSVQHLDFLTEHDKNVFKTFAEISQKEILIQAAARQKFIDQGQSINMMIHPQTKPKDVHSLILFAWENGIKSLYYQRGTHPAQELQRNLLTCASCEA